MNWKRLRDFNLARLLPGHKAAPGAAPPAPFWRKWPFRRRTLPTRVEQGYTPGLYYKTLLRREAWRGPRYLRPAKHAGDLAMVLAELGAIVRANVPLCPALEACARERQRVLGMGGLMLPRGARAMSMALLAVSPFALAALMASRISEEAAFTFMFMGIVASAITARNTVRAGQPIEALFLVLSDRIRAGRTLSEAMRTLPRFFPAYSADIVAAGEDSGKLGATLDGLARHACEQRELCRGLSGTLLYLGTLVAAHLFIGGFIVVKSVPVFQEIVTEFDTTPDPLRAQAVAWIRGWSWNKLLWGNAYLTRANQSADTQIMGTENLYLWDLVPGGHWIANHLLLSGAILSALLFIRWFIKAYGGRCASPIVRAGYLVPGLRGAIATLHWGRAAGVIHLLTGAGVPLPEALGRAASLPLMPQFQRAILRLRKRIEQGDGLAQALRKDRHVPAPFAEAMALGEASGRLSASLAFIEEVYGLRARTRLRVMSAIVLPAGVIGVASLTLFIEWLSMGAILEVTNACIDATL